MFTLRTSHMPYLSALKGKELIMKCYTKAHFMPILLMQIHSR